MKIYDVRLSVRVRLTSDSLPEAPNLQQSITAVALEQVRVGQGTEPRLESVGVGYPHPDGTVRPYDVLPEGYHVEEVKGSCERDPKGPTPYETWWYSVYLALPGNTTLPADFHWDSVNDDPSELCKVPDGSYVWWKDESEAWQPIEDYTAQEMVRSASKQNDG